MEGDSGILSHLPPTDEQPDAKRAKPPDDAGEDGKAAAAPEAATVVIGKDEDGEKRKRREVPRKDIRAIVISWEEAMEQCSQDEEFLRELLGDLKEEIKESDKLLQIAITSEEQVNAWLGTFLTAFPAVAVMPAAITVLI